MLGLSAIGHEYFHLFGLLSLGLSAIVRNVFRIDKVLHKITRNQTVSDYDRNGGIKFPGETYDIITERQVRSSSPKCHPI